MYPHLEVLPGHVHPDEIVVSLVLLELLEDSLGRLLGGLERFDGPVRQEFVFVGLDFERALLAASDLVLLGMLAEINVVLRVGVVCHG